MLFFLKKFVSFWIMPLPFCVVLLGIGLVLAWCTKRVRLGRALAVAAIALLVLFSNHFVSRALIRPLETQFAPIPELVPGTPTPRNLAACRYIVVLGSGNGHSRDMAALSELSKAGLARIVEAARLLRVLPDAKLIVSGPGDGKRAPHAVVLARAATSLGIPERNILLIDRARDTEEEARSVAREIGDAPFALVTSAWHMPRAVALFRHHGLDPLPAPADFVTHAADNFSFTQLLFDERALAASTWGIRERIGYLWIWLRGKTSVPTSRDRATLAP